jgi:uncharacterized protein (DUF2235 family)
MPKNIVICADGTGNKYGATNTNVARFFAALDRSDPMRQVAAYFPGIGTIPSASALTAVSRLTTQLASLVVGYGLLDLVAQMYAFLMAHYVYGDRIYLVGFSRGAFAVRALAGLIHRCGVLLPGSDHLIPYALRLYTPHVEHLPVHSRKLQRHKKALNRFVTAFSWPRDERPIELLALWDTVKSFGYFWPRSLPHTRHNPSVHRLRHALSLDERRAFYQATTWGGIDNNDKPAPKDQLIEEVWFAGVHSDVGGGLEDDEGALARVTFEWMLEGVLGSDLCFDTEKLRAILGELPTFANSTSTSGSAPRVSDTVKVHASLWPWWWIAELLPRVDIRNVPPKPYRVLVWTPFRNRRKPEKFARHGKISVHNSVQLLHEQAGYQLSFGNPHYVPPREIPSHLDLARDAAWTNVAYRGGER